MYPGGSFYYKNCIERQGLTRLSSCHCDIHSYGHVLCELSLQFSPQKEHPALQNMKFLEFFLMYFTGGSFCLPGSESNRPKLIRIRILINVVNLGPLVNIPCRTPFWVTTPPLWASMALHWYISSPVKLLNFDINADPDPDFHSNADYSDPKIIADPDHKPCFAPY